MLVRIQEFTYMYVTSQVLEGNNTPILKCAQYVQGSANHGHLEEGPILLSKRWEVITVDFHSDNFM